MRFILVLLVTVASIVSPWDDTPTLVLATDCSDIGDGGVRNCCAGFDGVCDGCNTGYTTTNNGRACTKCKDPKCQVCEKENPGKCIQKGVPPPKHCKYIQNHNWCGGCDDGYMLVAKSRNDQQLEPGMCLPSPIKNCAWLSRVQTPTQQPQCNQCIDGYGLSKNACVTCQDSKCSKCDNGSCSVCQDGYILSQGKCVTCNAPNCIYCQDGNPNKCSFCNLDKNYVNDGTGTCRPCAAKNCKKCFSDTLTKCQQCNNGYQFNVQSYQCE